MGDASEALCSIVIGGHSSRSLRVNRDLHGLHPVEGAHEGLALALELVFDRTGWRCELQPDILGFSLQVLGFITQPVKPITAPVLSV